jgi:O-antigen/teichoic acid export membrane protein
MQFRQFITRVCSLGSILMIVNILYYVYQFILNRYLAPLEYGIVSQVISFTIIGSIPSVIVNLLVMKYVTWVHRDDEKWLIRYIWRGVVKIIWLLSILAVILSPIITRFIQIDFALYFMIILNIVVIICLAFWRAVEYSRGNLRKYGQNFILEVSLRIVWSYIFLLYSHDVHWLYFIYLLSFIIPLSLFYSQIVSLQIEDTIDTSTTIYKNIRSYIWPLSVMAISMTCIGNIEVILAGRLLGTIWAAEVGSMMLIGKIILVWFGFISTFGIAYFADTMKNKKIILMLYSMTALVTLVLVFLSWVLGPQIVRIILPDVYVHTGEYMYIFIPAMTILGWISVLLTHASLSDKRAISYASPIIFICLIISTYYSPHDLWWFILWLFYGYLVGIIFLVWLIALSYIRYSVNKEWSYSK